MNSKKADLMSEEGLKILMAVLAIIILFYLAFSLYGIFTNKTEIEQATAVLADISGKATALAAGESSNYLITSPKGWYFLIFDKGGPQDCKGKSCICICPSISKDSSSMIEICDKSGICQLSPSMSSENVCSSTANCISFEKLPISVKLNKDSSGIQINVQK